MHGNCDCACAGRVVKRPWASAHSHGGVLSCWHSTVAFPVCGSDVARWHRCMAPCAAVTLFRSRTWSRKQTMHTMSCAERAAGGGSAGCSGAGGRRRAAQPVWWPGRHQRRRRRRRLPRQRGGAREQRCAADLEAGAALVTAERGVGTPSGFRRWQWGGHDEAMPWHYVAT